MKSCVSALVAGVMMCAAPALAGDGFTLAALSADAATGAAVSTGPALAPAEDGIRVSEWIGAPCMTDADCTKTGADLKCDNGTCVQN